MLEPSYLHTFALSHLHTLRPVELRGEALGVVLRTVAQLLDRVGDVPVAAAVGGYGVEDAEVELALDRAPGHLRGVARAEPHPAADRVVRFGQEPADAQADHREAVLVGRSEEHTSELQSHSD